jgi:predicted Zn-dependent protease
MRERIPVPVHVLEPLDLPDPLAERAGALPSNEIVAALEDRFPWSDDAPVPWVLGVIARDLVAPGRSFVFGEAALGGAWAILATPRLILADPPDSADLHRLETEAFHELGHLADLPHCDSPDCVMNRSPDLPAVDRKSPLFCHLCTPTFFAAFPP